MAKELLLGIYASRDIFHARLALERFFEWAAHVEVPEVTRLAPHHRPVASFHNYRTRMLLKTAVSWQTPITPRLRGAVALKANPPPPRSSRRADNPYTRARSCPNS